ncbi:PAS domain S-box protein [Algoriphagus aestuarii]|nr:PAS domain S-box protein [Algoriphagus aestuarii]
MTNDSFEYERFFEMSPDLLCIAGYDGYFKKINHAVAETLGYSKSELYARPINDFVYHEDQRVTSDARNEIIKSKPLLNFENRYVHKSGEIIWLSWTSQPFDDQKLVFAIAKDITHKKRIESERNSLLEKTSRLNEKLKQISFTTSHDLRSPVNNLLSILDLLDKTKIKDSESLELIDLLEFGLGNLKTTLNTYVDHLKESHSTNAKKESVSISKTINGVSQSIKSLIHTSKAEIDTDLSEFDEISFNKTYFESIILNFLTNSIKYSKPGIPPKIKIQSAIKDGKKQLIIEDNGQGFDAKDLEHKIFGIGDKIHENPDSKGIGLYLVYSHVMNMRGKIEVKSKIHQGTRFTITF